jgi:methionyl-tRNA formyltransferase
VWEGQELLLHDIDALPMPPPAAAAEGAWPPGTALYEPSAKRLAVACADATWLAVPAVQRQNRRRQSAHDFVNGYRLPKAGTVAVFGRGPAS